MIQKEFLDRIRQFESCPTVYVNGAFGAVASTYNKNRYHNSANITRWGKIENAPSDAFFADCCGLIKGVLWGWIGDIHQIYGGADYKANGVPDTNELGLIELCQNVSTDFSHISDGEMVYMKGHCGVYIGNGLVIESTPAWECGVQKSGVANLGVNYLGHNRTWLKHGKLPWVIYDDIPELPYSNQQFRADVRAILGVSNDLEAFNKTITISTIQNRSNALVTPLERYFKALGYYTGEIEAGKGRTPIYGNGMKSATKLYQRYVVHSSERDIDGVITKKAQTWKKLLLG